LYLASNSPRRRQLLALTGWNFQVAPADVDETPLPDELPRSYVLRLAEKKARAAALLLAPAGLPVGLVLASDTTVVEDGTRILGKPSDPEEAVQMLRRLRGRVHEVYTALAVLRQADGSLFKDVCVTRVPMRAYSDAEIEAYVATGDPLDKAGAYAIQHAGFHPVEDLRGCFAGVMGLPLCHLVRLLRRMGVEPEVDVPLACQQNLAYACPISAAVLRGEE
jgi:septum formation protein